MQVSTRLYNQAVAAACLAIYLSLNGVVVWSAEFHKRDVLDPCTKCHTDRFLNGPFEEWKVSTHKDLVNPESPRSPAKRDGCVFCHSGQGFAQGTKKKADVREPLPITCVACHSVENHGKVPAYVRKYGRITLPDKVTIANAGTGAVCMACHNSRRDVTNANILIEKRAPHGSTQADMLKGSGAFEIEGYRYSNSVHSTIENGCVTCHMAPPQTGVAKVVGSHTFKVSSEKIQNTNACVGCHRSVEVFNRPALGDFDGDKTIEAVQDEVNGLLEVVKKAVEDRIDGGKGGTMGESHGRVAFKGKDGKKLKPEAIPDAQYIAAYNYFFVHNDKSHGIHNTAYAVQLLQSSYQNLTGNPVPNAYIR